MQEEWVVVDDDGEPDSDRIPPSRLRKAGVGAAPVGAAPGARLRPHPAALHRVGVTGSGAHGPGQGVEGDPVLQVEQHPSDPHGDVAVPGAAGGVDDRAVVGVPARRRGGWRR